MTAPLPCTICPAIPCAYAGKCYGHVHWAGKTGFGKPLKEVQECKWRDKCREWYRRNS